ncbi:hypothetical protein FGE12_26545 [Aggregicoccus sp. 17bor-14]|uniref:hypothetical protein n=1 Tax=Myxococcaceae TaxID=31 RepID=UPI00129C2D3D|nr:MULTISPECIES: hypothetical protein [Myxococcaceae]MBF5046000.1 hypothetical protein [Simulacricoccus sp. 17bor-14]MRI91731.1 hypothetical protein [Aggregicoccus sp. 17bor-14]
MNRTLKLLALSLTLALTACGGDDTTGPRDTGDTGGTGGSSSHLGGTATAYGACDNPQSPPSTCYTYVGSSWAGQTASAECSGEKGTFSATQGCTGSGRGGRCTLFAGTANEYVAHCYLSTSQCQQTCNGIGDFSAN